VQAHRDGVEVVVEQVGVGVQRDLRGLMSEHPLQRKHIHASPLGVGFRYLPQVSGWAEERESVSAPILIRVVGKLGQLRLKPLGYLRKFMVATARARRQAEHAIVNEEDPGNPNAVKIAIVDRSVSSSRYQLSAVVVVEALQREQSGNVVA
jgi:hypothetical protein